MCYVRHSNIDYLLNMISHLGIPQSLQYGKKQNKIAECTNIMAKMKSFDLCTSAF